MLVEQIKSVDIYSLEPHPENANIYGDVLQVSDLVESVREIGIRQPIIVRLMPSGLYRIISGERRWRAALELKMDRVPIVVHEFVSEEQELLVLLHCNKQRVKTQAQIAAEYERISSVADAIGRMRQQAALSGVRPLELIALEQSQNVEPDKPFEKRDFIRANTGISIREQSAMNIIMNNEYRDKEEAKLRSMGANPEQLQYIRAAWNDVRAVYKEGLYSEKKAVDEIQSNIAKLKAHLQEAKGLSKNHAKKESTKYGDIKRPHSDKNLAEFVKEFLAGSVAECMMSDREVLEKQVVWAVRRYLEVVKS